MTLELQFAKVSASVDARAQAASFAGPVRTRSVSLAVAYSSSNSVVLIHSIQLAAAWECLGPFGWT